MNSKRFQKALHQDAFHGSPYKFDAFKSEAIGTGEGHQAYGYGIYLAEDQNVAGWYRDKLSKYRGDGWVVVFPDGSSKTFEEIFGSQAGSATTLADQFGGDLHKMQNVMDQRAGMLARSFKSPEEVKTNQRYQDLASLSSKLAKLAFKEEAYLRRGTGYLYKVRVPDEAFLDWEAPFSQQAPSVQAGVRKAVMEADLVPSVEGYLGVRSRPALFQKLTQYDPDGETVYGTLSDMTGGAKEASATLLAAGVPGIEYLDQASRTAGMGHKNLVVFDPGIIEIVERQG